MLSRLHPGEQFAYVFDLGDDWARLCTVGARRIGPVEVLGGTTVHLWGSRQRKALVRDNSSRYGLRTHWVGGSSN